MKNIILALALFAVCAYSQGSKVALEITADAGGVIPIAIVMFQPQPASPVAQVAQPWRTIASNLDFTGDFSVVRLNTVDTVRLAEEQIPIYVSGTYVIEGDSMTLEIAAYESGRHGLLFANTYTFHKSKSREIAHRFSNELHRALLGNDGPYETKILYVENTAREVKNIVICDFDGQNRRRLTNGGINILPSFMGKDHILFVSFEKGKPDIYSLNIKNGEKRTIVASRRVESSPNYSEITGRIAYASSKGGNMEIYTITRDGENEQRLTVNPPSISTAPRWAPNGHTIAFVSDRTGNPQIYVMDRTGSNVRRITFGGSYHDSPAWSPDGLRIAYTARRGGRNIIVIGGLDNSNEEELLTLELGGSQEFASWSPDGSHIIFTHRQGGRTDIAAIRLKDGKITKITDSGNAEQPNWSGF